MEKVWGENECKRYLLEPGDNKQILDYLFKKRRWIAIRYPTEGFEQMKRLHGINGKTSVPWVFLTSFDGNSVTLLSYNILPYEKADELFLYGEYIPFLSQKIEGIDSFLTRARNFGAYFYYMNPFDLWAK